ncbi:hypothetical protein DRO19_00110 [Candidatus Bathyarchaeota archaeon]|nr:MAG: hypothetical protein DRO19_00110 [Candidatus Bathyarchaeota archaeon]
MKIWKVYFRESHDTLDSVFEELTVLAENFDEAVKKAKEWKNNYPSLNLEISGIELQDEVDIE